jgi:hypothetical protein
VQELAESDKNDALSNLDALDPRRVKANLPDEEASAKEAEELSEMCDDTRRRGAGVIRSGLVGLRPLGMDKWNRFHERFTEKKGRKRRKKELVDLRKQLAKKAYEGPRFKVYAFPETFCVLCFSRDCPPGEGMINLQPVTADWRPRGLIPGDVIRHLICRKCTMVIKEENRSEVQIFHDGQMMPAKVIKQAARAKKLMQNIEIILAQSAFQEIGQGGDAHVLAGGA